MAAGDLEHIGDKKTRALLECAAAQGDVWCVQAAAAAAQIPADEATHIAGELATTHPHAVGLIDDGESVRGLDFYAFRRPDLVVTLVASDEDERARQRAASAAALENAFGPAVAIPSDVAAFVAALWSESGCRARLAAWYLRCAETRDSMSRSADLWSLDLILVLVAESPALSTVDASLELYGRSEPVDLAEVAAAAFRLAEEPMLRAELLLAQAFFHAQEHGYDPAALDLLRRAMDTAATCEKKYILLIAAAEYGRAVAKDDLTVALRVLRHAVDLARDPANTGDGRAARAGWSARLQLGINLFDAGDLSAGFASIYEVCRSDDAGKYGIIRPMAWHFLAQVWESVGMPSEARQALSACLEACRAVDLHPQSAGWRAYAAAQLARIDARYRPDTGIAEIAERAVSAQAAARAEQRACPTLPPITDVLCADTLTDLATADPGHAETAHAIAFEALERARGGVARPQIAALNALARAELALGRSRSAERHALEAVELLEQHGGSLPALRSEEVLATAARSTLAAGDPVQAGALVERAAHVVREKFRTLLAGDSDQLLHAARAFPHEPVNRDVANLAAQLSP